MSSAASAPARTSTNQLLADRRRRAAGRTDRRSDFDAVTGRYTVGTTHELHTDEILLDENTRSGEPDPAWIAELRRDMEDEGQLQNAGVWVDDAGKIRLVFGFSRYHAAKGSEKLGGRLRVIVRPPPARGRESTLVTQIVENERRKDLSMADRATAYDDLVAAVAERWKADPDAARREALEQYGERATTPDTEVAARLGMNPSILSRYRTIASCDFAPLEALTHHPECRDPTSVGDLVTLAKTHPDGVAKLVEQWIGSREPAAPGTPAPTPLGLRAATRKLKDDSRAARDRSRAKPGKRRGAATAPEPSTATAVVLRKLDGAGFSLVIDVAGADPVEYRIDDRTFDHLVDSAVVLQSSLLDDLAAVPVSATSPG